MIPLISIISFSLFFLITFIVLVKRDIFIGGFYAFLYIYTIFSQIGYAYFPELSMLLNSYFGKALFYDYHYFVFLSFIAYFIVTYIYIRVSNPLYKAKYRVVKKPKNMLFGLYMMSYFIYLTITTFYFVVKYNELTYTSMPTGNYVLFGILFKNLTIFTYVHYAAYRNTKPKTRKKVIFIFFLFSIILEFLIAIKIGSRTDIIALFLGIFFYEMYISVLQKNVKRKLYILLQLGILLIIGLNILEQVRSVHNPNDDNLAKALLFKDYFAPGHILIASIHYNIVDPLKVILSNFYNSLVKMNYPYLQTDVGNMLIGESSSRSTGFAMYIFSEGYMFAGWLGFIYNGIIVSSGIILWRWLARSNNYLFNAFVLGLVATQLANMARSQSMYFIKDFYMIFIMAFILYYSMTGVRPMLRRMKESRL